MFNDDEGGVKHQLSDYQAEGTVRSRRRSIVELDKLHAGSGKIVKEEAQEPQSEAVPELNPKETEQQQSRAQQQEANELASARARRSAAESHAS